MRSHWDTNLNVKQLVLEKKPKLIVECGAGSGENTQQYLDLGLPFKMIVISDGELPPRFEGKTGKDFQWIFGISYLELDKFDNESIDFCSIDTDHDYYTLKMELRALKKKLTPGGVIVIHDTESYRHNSGHMDHYNCGVIYPVKIIEYEVLGKMYGDAIAEAVEAGKYRVIAESLESNGAMALVRV